MSNLNEEDIAKILDFNIVKDYRYNDKKGHWEQLISYETKEDGMVNEWCGCTIVDVSLERLLTVYEDLVAELSNKEIALYTLKEEYIIAENKIIANTDFKALYGKNNEKVRKEHCKSELSDRVSQMKDLEFSISWIKNYLPLIREVVRSKQ